MPELTNNSDLEFTEATGDLTGIAKRLNDGTNTATAAEVRALLDRSLVENEGSTPGIIYGTATDLDAEGNPTPDTSTYDPTALAEGTLLFTTTAPTAADNGTGVTTTYSRVDMRFRVVAGAWVWDGGTFRATNSNGDYQRFADRTQECDAQLTMVFVSASVIGIDWTFPAEFAALPRAHHLPTATSENITPGFTELATPYQVGPTTTAVTLRNNIVNGMTSFGASDSLVTYATAKGRW